MLAVSDIRNDAFRFRPPGGRRMREIPIHGTAELGTERLEAVRAAIQPLCTLRDVLAWSRGATRSGQPIDIVTQDEYTHDVVFDLDGTVHLAFDTT